MLEAHFFDRNGNLLDILDQFVWFSVTQKLSDIGNASIEIDNDLMIWRYVDYSEIVKENNRVILYIVEGWVAKTLFEWYIRGKKLNLVTTKIYIDDRKGIFDDKALYANITYTGSIDWLLQNILNDINTRENTLITLSCGLMSSITKTYKEWEVVYSVIEDIAGDKYEWIVKDNVLCFKESVGIDRSIVGDNYLEYTRDYLNPYNKTVNVAEMTTDIKDFANCTIWRSGGTKVQYSDSASITEYGRVERPITNSWDIANSVQDYINARKEQFRQYDIQPMENNFFACDIWDIVKVYIDRNIDEMYYDGTMKVVEKSMEWWDINKVRIRLAKGKFKTVDMFAKIKQMDKKIQKIEMTK